MLTEAHLDSPTLCSPTTRGHACLLPVPAHEAARWRAPPPRLATSCLVASLLDARRRHAPPRPPLTSPSLSGPPSPSLLCFPSRDRMEAVAADQRSRGHSHRLASPTPPRAPLFRPRPPHRLTRPEGPRAAAIDIVFKLRPRRPSPSIRPLRRAPEPTNPPCSSAVSL